VSEDNVVRLLKLLEPELKRSMHTIYQHINSRCPPSAPLTEPPAAAHAAMSSVAHADASSVTAHASPAVPSLAHATPSAAHGSVSVVDSRQQQVELPYFSKFLLIAAYIASYNPSKTDRRFFVKVSS
jgi:hypothetical protein